MYKKYIKRFLDICGSLCLLPILGIIVVFVAPLIILDDGFPVFYVANRLGKNGKFFKMYKFRSMKKNAPDLRNEDGTTYNSPNDVRVTRVGRILRKTSLDEVPQILNVLKGDMSIVGPRANLTTHYPGLDKLDPSRQKRLTVRPGITGYNQAYFRNSVGTDQRIKNDVYYVEHICFKMDMLIIFKTILAVLERRNIYSNTGEQEIGEKVKR